MESQVAKNGMLYVSRGRLFAGQASTRNELTRTRSLGLYGLRIFQRYGEFDGHLGSKAARGRERTGFLKVD